MRVITRLNDDCSIENCSPERISRTMNPSPKRDGLQEPRLAWCVALQPNGRIGCGPGGGTSWSLTALTSLESSTPEYKRSRSLLKPGSRVLDLDRFIPVRIDKLWLSLSVT